MDNTVNMYNLDLDYGETLIIIFSSGFEAGFKYSNT